MKKDPTPTPPMYKLQIPVSQELRYKLKLMAAKKKMTLKEFLLEALNALLD